MSARKHAEPDEQREECQYLEEVEYYQEYRYNRYKNEYREDTALHRPIVSSSSVPSTPDEPEVSPERP